MTVKLTISLPKQDTSKFKEQAPLIVDLSPDVPLENIINYIKENHKFPVPQDYIAVLRNVRKQFITLKAGDSLGSVNSGNECNMYLYPKIVFLNLIFPDRRKKIAQYETSIPISQIRNEVCEVICKLKRPLAYQMFPSDNPNSFFYNPDLTLVEGNYLLNDMHLLRRFWFDSFKDLVTEGDYHFHYVQARKIIFDDILYEKGTTLDLNLLVGLSLIVDFDANLNNVKAVFKKPTKEVINQYLPKWAKKDFKKLLAGSMKVFEAEMKKGVIAAKGAFLIHCLSYQYFALRRFKCSVDDISKPGEKLICDLVFTSKAIVCLKPQTWIEIFHISLDHIFKFKELHENNEKGVNFMAVLDPGPITKQSIGSDWKVYYENSPDIIQYYYSLVEYLQKNKKTEEELAREKNYIAKALNPNAKPINLQSNHLAQNKLFAGNAIPAPNDQTFVLVDFNALKLNRVETEIEKMKLDYSKDLDSNLMFMNSELNPNEIIELFKSVLSGNDDLTSVDRYITNLSAKNPKVTKIPLEILKKEVFSLDEEISLIADALGYLSYFSFPPQSAFDTIHVIKDLLAQYSKSKWDSPKVLDDLDVDLQPYVKAALLNQDNLPTAVAYVVHGLLGDKLDNSNQAYNQIVDLLNLMMLEEICAAKILAQNGAIAFNPSIQSLPEVPCYEPFLFTKLSKLLFSEAIPDGAVLHPESYNLFIKDCISISQFIKSPIGLFIQSKTPQILNGISDPTTLPDILNSYRLARENAFVLWNVNQFQNGSRVKGQGELASNCLALADLNPADMIKKLMLHLQANRPFIQSFTSITSVMDENDQVFNLIRNLLDQTNDIDNALSFLAYDSLSPDQKIQNIQLLINQISNGLANLSKISNQNLAKQLKQWYAWMSYGYLSATKDLIDVHPLIKKFLELGELIQFALDEQNPMEQRLNAADKARGAILILGLIQSDPLLSVQRFLQGPIKSNALSKQIIFQFEPVDVSPAISLLKSISSILKAMADFTATNETISA